MPPSLAERFVYPTLASRVLRRRDSVAQGRRGCREAPVLGEREACPAQCGPRIRNATGRGDGDCGGPTGCSEMDPCWSLAMVCTHPDALARSRFTHKRCHAPRRTGNEAHSRKTFFPVALRWARCHRTPSAYQRTGMLGDRRQCVIRNRPPRALYWRGGVRACCKDPQLCTIQYCRGPRVAGRCAGAARAPPRSSAMPG